MTDTVFLIFAWFAFAIVALLFWVEYRISDCDYGGSSSGKDNWIIQIIRGYITKRKAARAKKIKDICDF